MYTHLLVRSGELFLKGKNYPQFEQRLKNNISAQISVPLKDIISSRGRLILPYFVNHQSLHRVFGLTSYSPVICAEANISSISSAVLQLLGNKMEKEKKKKGTFKIEAKRSDKRFPISSSEINRVVGQFIEKNTSMHFQREDPEHLIQIEINNKGAFLFWETVPCFGGLPVGSEGPILLLVENENSILAGLLTMKRGISIIPVALQERNTHLGEISLKKFDNHSLLQKFSPKELKLIIFSNYAEMEKFSIQKKISVIVIGDFFGSEMKRTFGSLLVLKPLIAFDEDNANELMEEYKKGG